MRQKLTGAARAEALATLAAAGWAEAQGRDAVEKTYRFDDFPQAFGWMTRVALAAEKMDHHPEWTNVWREVRVVLTTHSAGGLTALDVALARRMDEMAP